MFSSNRFYLQNDWRMADLVWNDRKTYGLNNRLNKEKSRILPLVLQEENSALFYKNISITSDFQR